MHVKSIIRHLLLVPALWAGPALAQQPAGQLGDEQIQVVKPYQPILSDAVKISDAPQKDTMTVLPPVLNYSVAEKRLDTKYNVTPIKPVRIKDETISELYRGYVKAGYGNYNTTYGEGYFNALRSKEFDAGVHLRHLSSSGKIKGYGFPGFSENEVSVFGKKYLRNAELTGRIGYDREVVHYYGFTLDNFSKKVTLHRMGAFDGAFSLASTHNDKHMIDYSAKVSFTNWSDNLDQLESDFTLGGSVGHHLNNNHTVSAEFEINPTLSQTPGEYCPPGEICPVLADAPQDVSVNRTHFRIRPRYAFTKDKIGISAGANIAVESAYDETKWHLYPVVEAHYPLIKNAVMVSGELSGDLMKNTLRGMNDANPFLVPPTDGNDLLLVNTGNKLNIRGGLEVKVDRDFMVAASAGVSRFRDDLFFVNSVNTTGITTYAPGYFNCTRLNIHAEATYSHKEKSGLWLKADYYSYDVAEGQQAWFRPSMVMSFGGHYAMARKIYLSTEMVVTGPRKALTADGEGTDLKGYIDASLGIDYRYSKVLSVFVKLNNFTASRYFDWYRYPSYRFNAMAGLSYSF